MMATKRVLLCVVAIALAVALAGAQQGFAQSSSAPLPNLLEPLDKVGKLLFGVPDEPLESNRQLSIEDHRHHHEVASKEASRSLKPSQRIVVVDKSRHASEQPNQSSNLHQLHEQAKAKEPTVRISPPSKGPLNFLFRRPSLFAPPALPTDHKKLLVEQPSARRTFGSITAQRHPSDSRQIAPERHSDTGSPTRIASRTSRASTNPTGTRNGQYSASGDSTAARLYERLKMTAQSPFDLSPNSANTAERHATADAGHAGIHRHPEPEKVAKEQSKDSPLAADNQATEPDDIATNVSEPVSEDLPEPPTATAEKSTVTKPGKPSSISDLLRRHSESNDTRDNTWRPLGKQSNVPHFNSSDTDKTAAGNTENLTDSKADVPAQHSTQEPAARSTHQATTGNISTLVERQMPQLEVEVTGPAEVKIGQEGQYRLTIKNTGDVPADRLLVNIGVPMWAELHGIDTARGSARLMPSAQDRQTVVWQLDSLPAHSSDEITLTLKPTSGTPLSLEVSWDYAQKPLSAVIEVKQPELQMQLKGPNQLRRNRPAEYLLSIINTGNAEAENVSIDIKANLPSQIQPAQKLLDIIEPGQQIEIPLEVEAELPGMLSLQAVASSSTGQTVSTQADVEVIEPKLVVRTELSSRQLAGVEVPCRLVVENTGTAAAENVRLEVPLPAGAILPEKPNANTGSASEQASQPVKLQDGVLQWQLGDIAPGESRQIDLVLEFESAGRYMLSAKALSEDAAGTANATVDVKGYADLVLKLSDPGKATAVGQKARYEVHVTNQGTDVARGVQVIVFFSEGIEPVDAQGGKHVIGPGQVVFAPVDQLPPGKELVFVVLAEAQQEGTHICRAQVECQQPNVKLVRDESSTFFSVEDEAQLASSPDDSVRR